ncbi:Serine/threonine-protein kinase pkn3 [Minicystis rosea]|nr:Serine/threonine-protein kinase pkn3 [Minicystis rosea]
MLEPLWREGEIFAGKYRVEEVLGRGGMGIVLGARHTHLDEPVAIKVLLPSLRDTPGVIDRFLREARAAAKIKSEHVVRVTDVDTLPSGVPFIVMERLDGMDLAELCKQRQTLEIEEVVRYVVDACDAVAEAHARGIVHRDIKPANLFLARQPDGSTTVKVLDFGISKLSSETGEHVVTAADQALGSPSYMSPEQMRSARDVDARTDIWALGAVLFRLLTGKTPFRADNLPQLYSLVTTATLQRPSELRGDLPPGLEAVIIRCLEKDPDLRFASVDDLVDALLPFAGEDAPVPSRRRSRLLSIDRLSGPTSARSGPLPESVRGAGSADASERRTGFEASDSAALLTSAVRTRAESDSPVGATTRSSGEKRGATRTIVVAVMVAIVAAGAGLRVVHRAQVPIAAGGAPDTAPTIALEASRAAPIEPPPVSRAPTPSAEPEPLVIPAASIAASVAAPPKRPARRDSVEKKAAVGSSRDPFGGTRK